METTHSHIWHDMKGLCCILILRFPLYTQWPRSTLRGGISCKALTCPLLRKQARSLLLTPLTPLRNTSLPSIVPDLRPPRLNPTVPPAGSDSSLGMQNTSTSRSRTEAAGMTSSDAVSQGVSPSRTLSIERESSFLPSQQPAACLLAGC